MCCGRSIKTVSTSDTASPPKPAPSRAVAPQSTATQWQVTLPGGTTRVVRSEVAARLIVGANPGATYQQA
jgi:hypothetical protein